MRKFKIIMHTHWDREWYFTKDETQTILRTHMYEVIDYLENNKDVKYILDGQSIMIDDFLEFASDYEQRLKKLIEKGQLLVGPWYTQSDLMIVHGESIIRNLYYGISRARQFSDNTMLNGYAPDTFGHNSQMPQIYKQFGIDNTFFWRGFSELKAEKSDFLWKGIDGSVIYGINLATGYQGAKYLEDNEEELKIRMNKIMKVLDKYSTSDSRLIMNGHDQMPIQRNIKEIIPLLKNIYPDDDIEIGTFDDYINDIRGQKLEIVEGELVHSKHARIHKTINSTRMDIKLLNTELEYKLFNILEPLAIFAEKIAIEYPHDLFEKCYKIMFGTHAHDSIGGCNTDQVNADIKQRLLQVKEIIDTQIEMYMRIITQTQVDEGDITLFNYLPYERKNQLVDLELLVDNKDFIIQDENKNELNYIINSHEIIDAGTIDRQIAARLLDIKTNKYNITVNIPSIDGFTVQNLNIIENKKPALVENDLKCENDYYQITIGNRTIDVYDKINKKTISNFLTLENSADCGDSYDYSPPLNDSKTEIHSICNVQTKFSNIIKKIFFDVKFFVPNDFKKREQGIYDVEMIFNITMTLDNSKLIKIDINTTNIVSDSRFRLVIKTDCASDLVQTDMQLSKVSRPIYNYPEMEVWEKEKWVEKPVAIETFNSYINYSDDNSYNVVYAYGHKEYEIKNKNIYITLFRSFSHLGKRNLVNRPGRPSGIEVETPDNQLLDMKFRMKFAVSFIKEDTCESNLAKEWLTPIMGYQLKKYNRFNINNYIEKINFQPLNLNFENCTISSIKKTINGDLIIRLFNENDLVDLNFENEVIICDLLENEIKKVTKISINKNQIVTIKI